MRISRVLSSLVLALACGQAAHAAGVGFMNNTIVANIPKQDWQQLEKTIGQVLNDTPDGKTTTWTTQTKRMKGGPVTVALTPKNTINEGKCRLLSAEVSQQTKKEPWQFLFCKNAEGAWRASTD
jgi:surface antigen